VKPPTHVASGLVKALLLVGVLALLAGLFVLGGEMAFGGPSRPPPAAVVAVVLLLGAGVALIGAAIARDRRDCRREDQEAMPGFEVVIRPTGDGPES
jgi:hypothetical protein